MRDILRRNPLAFLLAVVMHVAIVAFMVVGVDWLEPPKPIPSDVEVIEATVIDASRLAAQMEQIQGERRQRADQQRREEQQRAEQQRQEEQRLADLKQQQE